MKLGPYLTSYTKINLKWIKHFSVRFKTVKIPEENIGENLLDIGLGNNFLGFTSKAQEAKANINK